MIVGGAVFGVWSVPNPNPADGIKRETADDRPPSRKLAREAATPDSGDQKIRRFR